MPLLSKANGLELTPVPHELSGLNDKIDITTCPFYDGSLIKW